MAFMRDMGLMYLGIVAFVLSTPGRLESWPAMRLFLLAMGASALVYGLTRFAVRRPPLSVRVPFGALAIVRDLALIWFAIGLIYLWVNGLFWLRANGY